MKKASLFLVLLLMPLLCLVSCGDDNDGLSGSPLVGEWQEFRSDGSTDEIFHKVFNEDGTGLHWATNAGKVDMWGYRDITWSITNGGKLRIIFDNGEVGEYAYSIKDDILTTTYTFDDGDTEIMTYKRVK